MGSLGGLARTLRMLLKPLAWLEERIQAMCGRDPVKRESFSLSKMCVLNESCLRDGCHPHLRYATWHSVGVSCPEEAVAISTGLFDTKAELDKRLQSKSNSSKGCGEL